MIGNHIEVARNLVVTYSNINEIFFDWIFTEVYRVGFKYKGINLEVVDVLTDVSSTNTFFDFKNFIKKIVGPGNNKTSKDNINYFWENSNGSVSGFLITDFIDYAWNLKEEEEREQGRNINEIQDNP